MPRVRELQPRLPSGATAVVVREYQGNAPAGLILDWFHARGINWRISRPNDGTTTDDAAAIVALGSSASAYWTEPTWIAAESDLLAGAVEAGVPVLGICFGAQVLARALGGQVTRARTPELGWVRPESEHRELNGPYLTWHFDAITLPPGSVSLASTPQAVQAFASGRAAGLQFHPEVTPAIWRDWSEEDPGALTGHVKDPQALEVEIADSAQVSRERTFRLLDWWRASFANGV